MSSLSTLAPLPSSTSADNAICSNVTGSATHNLATGIDGAAGTYSTGYETITGSVTRDAQGGFSCHTCGKSFQSKTAAVAHLRKHSDLRRYPCSYCEMRFKDGSTLQQHIRRHTGERPYKCKHEGCDKAFKQKSQLDQHTRLHTGERPYACTHCTKTFVQKNHLDRHLRTHTGEKPYACGMCGTCFVDRSSLNQHAKKHGLGPISSPAGELSGEVDRRRSGRPRKAVSPNTGPRLVLCTQNGEEEDVGDLASEGEGDGDVPEGLLKRPRQEEGVNDWDV